MRYCHELVQHIGADMESRFYANGRRVTRAEYQEIETRAYMGGSVSCLWTRGRQMPGGKIRRTNGKLCQYN